MSHTVNKMDYFWNTFIGSFLISIGTYFQFKSGTLFAFANLKTGLDYANSVLSIVAYLLGIIATSITIYKFIKDKKE